MEKKKLSKKSLIIIGVILLVIILVLLICLLTGNKVRHDKNTILINKEIIINVGEYDQIMVVKSYEKDYKANDKVYGRVLIELRNNIDKAVDMSLYEFALLDTHNQNLATCSVDGKLSEGGLKKIFPSTVKPYATVNGYLYCPIEVEGDVAKVKISAVKDGKADDPKGYTYENYYVKFDIEQK